MRKKKLWAPLIAAALLLLCGCGNEAAAPAEPLPESRDALLRESLAGSWVSPDADMTARMSAALADSGELPALFEMPALHMDLELQLEADGTFTLRCSEEDSREGIAAVTAALEAGVREYLLESVRAAFAEKGIDAAREYEKYGCADEADFAEMSLGMTLEEVFRRTGLADAAETRWDSAVDSGTWAVEDGALTLNSAAAAYDAAADSIIFDSRVYQRAGTE